MSNYYFFWNCLSISSAHKNIPTLDIIITNISLAVYNGFEDDLPDPDYCSNVGLMGDF
jgi:hypothetical protein